MQDLCDCGGGGPMCLTPAAPAAVPQAPATLLGEAAALVEDEDGGRVFLHGNLVYAWAPGEEALRRWSEAQWPGSGPPGGGEQDRPRAVSTRPRCERVEERPWPGRGGWAGLEKRRREGAAR